MIPTGAIICPEIIGRDKELAALRQAVDAARGGHSQVFLLSGEAGIGKSRLVDECKKSAAQAGMVVFQGACFEQDQNFPFSMWIEGVRSMLSQPAGLRGMDPLRRLIAPFAPDLVKLLPEITDLLPGVIPSPTLDSEAEKHRLFETWGKLFARMSQDQALVMVLEDLHWSDEVSLELLQFLTRRILAQPVLLIATYRDDEATLHLNHILAQLERQHVAQEIHLDPLSHGESIAMVQRMVEAKLPPGYLVRSSTQDEILFYARGNPFYIEELLKLHLERASEDEAAPLPIPRSLRDTVQKHMLRLSEGAQGLLTCAAVAGERFRLDLLLELTRASKGDLLQRIHELLAASLLVETPTGELFFRHALIREAVYASLLLPERQSLHLQCAEAIEKLYPDRQEMMVVELAYHYYAAGAWEKALAYGQKAGERMLHIAATHEALAHYNRAIDAAGSLGVQPPCQALLARGKIYDRLGDSSLARADMLAALELARFQQDRRGECEALIALGFFISAQDFLQSITYFQQALAAARAIGEPALTAATLNRIGNWYVNQERPEKAETYHKEALAIYESLQDPVGIARTLELTAMQTYVTGDILAGGEACEKALSLFRSQGDREGIFYSLLNSQLNYTFDTDITPILGLGRLRERAEEAVEITRSIGWRSGEADALHIASMVARASGDYDPALRYERQAIRLMEELGHRTGLARALMTLGMIFLEALAYDEAIQALEQALPLAQETGSRSILITIDGLLAMAYVERRAGDDLLQAADILREVAQAIPIRTRHERYCWFARARLALATGNPGEALAVVETLLASTANLDTQGPQGIPRLALLAGDVLAALGKEDAAWEMVSAAREGASRQGRQGILWRALISQGKLALAQKQWAEAKASFAQAQALLRELAEPIKDEHVRAGFLNRGLALIPSLPGSLAHQAARQAAGGLTRREQEIARCIADGYTNRQIAHKCFISERTVERHVSNILLKLDFHTRSQVAGWARAHLGTGT